MVEPCVVYDENHQFLYQTTMASYNYACLWDFWYGSRTDVRFALIFFFINGLVLPFATGILLFPHCCWCKEAGQMFGLR